MDTLTRTLSNVDALRADWHAAEAIEQIAKEAYEKSETAELWLAHQRTVRDCDVAHSRYLDGLIAEQAALQRI